MDTAPKTEKKVPLRLCLGCREMKQKSELFRIVKSPDAIVSIDLKRKKPGRGAYVCNDIKCLNKVIKTNALARALKTKISEEIINELTAGYIKPEESIIES